MIRCRFYNHTCAKCRGRVSSLLFTLACFKLFIILAPLSRSRSSIFDLILKPFISFIRYIHIIFILKFFLDRISAIHIVYDFVVYVSGHKTHIAIIVIDRINIKNFLFSLFTLFSFLHVESSSEKSS